MLSKVIIMVIMKGMILPFIVVASGVSSFVEKKILFCRICYGYFGQIQSKAGHC